MPTDFYRCTDCGETTAVRHWPATRIDPPDSTHGDGCSKCGGELEVEPLDHEPDPDQAREREFERELEGAE